MSYDETIDHISLTREQKDIDSISLTREQKDKCWHLINPDNLQAYNDCIFNEKKRVYYEQKLIYDEQQKYRQKIRKDIQERDALRDKRTQLDNIENINFYYLGAIITLFVFIILFSILYSNSFDIDVDNKKIMTTYSYIYLTILILSIISFLGLLIFKKFKFSYPQ